MGCVSPSTVFPTREGYVALHCFAPGREWGITSFCLSPPRREKERPSLCPMVWDKGLQELGREAEGDYQIHPFCSQGRWREVAEFGLTHWYASSHLLAPKRRCWGKIIYTQIALLVCSSLACCRPLCKGSCKEGSAGPHFAMELDHPRTVQGTALRCSSILGCSILNLVTSHLFSKLLPAMLSPSPALTTSTELVIPHTKLTRNLCYI